MTKLLVAAAIMLFGSQALAQSRVEPKANDQRLYQSLVLAEEFIRSREVVLRIDATGDGPSLVAELELLIMNSRKTRWYTVASIPLTLKQTSFGTYSVAGFPPDMLRSDQAVTLKVTRSKGKETAELTVFNSDGKVFRRIGLFRVFDAGGDRPTKTHVEGPPK
jgi:hypothetical protein